MSGKSSNEFTSDFSKMVGFIFWNSFGFFFLDFLIPYVAAIQLDASGFEMGVIFSIRTFGYLIVAPFAGLLADRMSNKLLVFIGSVGRGLAYFVLYLSIVFGSLIGLVVGNFLLGFMAGFFWIPMDVLISQKSHKDHRSEAFGLRNSSLGKGIMVGAFIGFGSMGFAEGFNPGNDYLLYSALIVFGLANFYGGFRFFTSIDENLVFDEEEENIVKEANSLSYRAFFKSMERPFLIGLLLLMLALFLSTTNATIAKPFLLVYLTQNIESDPVIAASAYAPAGMMSMLLAPKIGKIADRLNATKVISVSAALGALTTWLLINTSNIVLFAFLLIIDMTIATTAGLVIQGIISRLSKQHRGKIFGIQTIFVDFGAIIGPIFGGILWDAYGYKSPFIFSIVVELMLIPVYIFALFKILPHLKEKSTTDKSEAEILPPEIIDNVDPMVGS